MLARSLRRSLSALAAITLAKGAAAQTAASPSEVRAVELRIESQRSPAWVRSRSPRFSWQLASERRGASQSAYRIRVRRLTGTAAPVFDSGEIQSPSSTLVELAGLDLAAGRSYVASLEVWDDVGKTAPPIDTAEFTIAPDAAMWLESSPVWDGTSTPNNYAYFRDQLEQDPNAQKATLYVTANESYRLHVDGMLLGTGPAPSAPAQALLYNAYDISAHLRAGAPTIAIEAHYLGAVPDGYLSGRPCLRTLCVVERRDGSIYVVGSLPDRGTLRVLAQTPYDETAALRGPAFGRVSAVEDFHADHAAATGEWRLPGFDDSAWPPPDLVGVPRYPLVLQEAAGIEEATTTPIATVRAEADGSYTVDVGAVTTGWPTLVLRDTQAGDSIRLDYATRLAANGRLAIGDGPDRITDFHDVYHAAGRATETWSPHYWETFRYLQISGLRRAPSPADITITRRNTRLREPSLGFSCSDPLLNAMYAMCERTQRACTQGAYLDTPQRERRQYLADAFIQTMNVAFTYEDPRLLPKLLRDARGMALIVPGFVPAAWPVDEPFFIGEWALHYPLSVWQAFVLHGDRRALRQHYPVLLEVQSLFEMFRTQNTGLLTGLAGFADWPRAPQPCDTRTSLNAFYYGVLRTMAAIAAELGRADDVQRFETLAADVRARIQQTLFVGDRYLDCLGETTTSQIASVFALHFDVVPPESRDAVLAFVESRGFETETYGGYYLTDVLIEAGRGQHLANLIRDRNALWARMLANGATTAWEAWTPLGSLCHAFTAYPLKFLKQMAGIDLVGPAWAEVRIRPLLVDELDFMFAEVPTPRGLLSAGWSRSGAGIRVDAMIPVGTQVEFWLPRRVLGELWIDGRLWSVADEAAQPADLPEGVEAVRATRDGYRVLTGGGRYLFETR